MRTLGEYKIPVLIKGISEGGGSKFFCAISGARELPVSLFVSEVAYLAHAECLYLIKPMVVGFVEG